MTITFTVKDFNYTLFSSKGDEYVTVQRIYKDYDIGTTEKLNKNHFRFKALLDVLAHDICIDWDSTQDFVNKINQIM